MECQPGIVPETIFRELFKWKNSKKVIGIYGGNASGKDRVCSDLLQHLLETDNRLWNDVCYLYVRHRGVTIEELFSAEWRSCFFESTMVRLKAMPRHVIVNDIWPFLDDEQSMMIWSMLTIIAEKLGVVFVVDSHLQSIRPWCDVLYEVDLNKRKLWKLQCEPEPISAEARLNINLQQIVKK